MSVIHTTSGNGRFCNQLIRNVCMSIIAKQHNLQVIYSNAEQLERLGIPLFSGTQCYPTTQLLTDDNFFELLALSEITYNVNPNQHYFQTNAITQYLYTYLYELPSILQKNPYQHRYQTNYDCFFHIRLGDVVAYNPGIHYYLHALQLVKLHIVQTYQCPLTTIYLATDSPHHPMINQLMKECHEIPICFYLHDEVDTIQFGSTCKYVILSHGSFSATIGWLAYYSHIYYPVYPSHSWCGDMFSIHGWHKIDLTHDVLEE